MTDEKKRERITPGSSPAGLPKTTSATEGRANWAGNYRYRARSMQTAASVEALSRLVQESRPLHALGTRHSFNSIADAEGGAQISVQSMQAMHLNAADATVTVGAGISYAQLGPWLHQQGWALANLASLPHISIVGATQTGTHGSGTANGSLSTAVEALDLMTAAGVTRHFSRATHKEQFDGMVVTCGALGIVTAVTLRIVPAYSVRQAVYEDFALTQLRDCLEEVFASGYSVSMFPLWHGSTAEGVRGHLWIKERVETSPAEPPAVRFGARLATRENHPVPGHDARNCTQQGAVPGPWHQRLPHFRSEFTPSSGEEIQSEYFVPLEEGYAAIEAVAALGYLIAPLLLTAELRTIAADSLWLSPCFERTSLAIHFTWRRDWPALQEILPRIEEALAPFHARPHWAKAFTMEPSQLELLYPHMAQFRALASELDPEGRFRNEFLKRYVFSAAQ